MCESHILERKTKSNRTDQSSAANYTVFCTMIVISTYAYSLFLSVARKKMLIMHCIHIDVLLPLYFFLFHYVTRIINSFFFISRSASFFLSSFFLSFLVLIERFDDNVGARLTEYQILFVKFCYLTVVCEMFQGHLLLLLLLLLFSLNTCSTVTN